MDYETSYTRMTDAGDEKNKSFHPDYSTPERKRTSDLALNFLDPVLGKKYMGESFGFNDSEFLLYGNKILMADRSGLFKRMLKDKDFRKLELPTAYFSALVSVWLYLNRVTDIAIPMANYNPRNNSLWTHGMSFKSKVSIWKWLEYFECDLTDEKIIEWFNLLKEDNREEFSAEEFVAIHKAMEPLSKRHLQGKNPKNQIEDEKESWQ